MNDQPIDTEARDDGDVPRQRGKPLPVDTATAPHEPAVHSPSTLGLWLLVLAGPGVWIVHFFVVYLAAEASCAADATPEMSFIGGSGIETLIVIATGVGILLCGLDAVMCRRWSSDSAAPDLPRIGTLLALLSAIAIVMVGVPILALPVCGP